MSHVTNLKEATSYLIGNRDIKKYIISEMKYITIMIEYMYLDFLHKKTDIENNFINNIFAVSSYLELINVVYYAVNSNKYNKLLEKYFYGEKNQKYLKEQQDKMIVEFQNFKIEKDDIEMSINQITKEIDKQLIEKNYMEIVKNILNNNA
jgi:hypothetical protein